jgi:curved DNA-binding protein CbpA
MINYYKILQVNKDASSIQIRKAYKRLTLMFQTDVSKSEVINEAFEILSDKHSRLSYDLALKAFDDYYKPKARIVRHKGIPYAKGVAGTTVEIEEERPAPANGKDSFLKYLFWFVLMALAAASTKR